MKLDDLVSVLPGIGEKRALNFRSIGITTVGELLDHFPRDYDDRSQVKTVIMLIPGIMNTIRGFIAAEPENINFNKSRPLIMTKARLQDQTGFLELIWFNQPYLKKYFKKDREYIFTGKVVLNFGRLQMESPEYEAVSDETLLSGGRIVPLYSTIKNISQKAFRNLIFNVLNTYDGPWLDDLPESLMKKYHLCGRKEAVYNIHFPENDNSFLSARKRLVFEELFFMQSVLLKMKGISGGQPGTVIKEKDYSPLTRRFPFSLTNAQKIVLEKLAEDMGSGGRMNRLIQGDVGSGKTAVAMAAAYLVIKEGFQAAIMAPTEVLAQQHFTQFNDYFEPLGIQTVLLTGGISAKERKIIQGLLKDGTAQMIVGTHALIQSKAEYNNLCLVITDEQHRFGVNQRLSLSKKGTMPHTLVMTATPIPRTLGLILYGDMDISVLDEMPPGRQKIKTYSVDSSYQNRIHEFIRKETSQGRQAYVICPAIEESVKENEIMKNVSQYHKELSLALPGISTACLHGRMKPSVKQQIMDDFKANKIQVIVSTTVIEVGVHVANATLIVIENADRFGLSQLHQLRGRVGRGECQSYCILITDSKNEQTQARMKAMTETTDGFRLSEMDLELRGAGDFFGVRQHGLPSFTIANLYRDMDILQEAQEAAVNVFQGSIVLTPDESLRCGQRISRLLDRASHTAVI